MSFSDRTMTEPYTSREVSTVPGEGDANLLLQDSKAAAPYSTTIRLLFVHLRTQWFYLPFSVGYDVLAKIFPYCYYDLTQQQPKSKRY